MQILVLMESAYGIFKADDDETKANRTKAWTTLLRDIPDDIGEAAFQHVIRRSKRPPVPADIVEEVENMRGTVSGDNTQAYWNLAWKAICGGASWDSLPDAVKEWFGSRQSMINMGQSEDTIESVLRGQFYKTFPQVKEQCDLRKNMPDNLKNRIESAMPKDDGPKLSDRERQLYENEKNRIVDGSYKESSDEELSARKERWLALTHTLNGQNDS